MTNYEFLKFLAENGGYYTASEHLALLKKYFPNLVITTKHIRSVRGAIRESKLVEHKIKPADGNQWALRVVSVDPAFENFARARPPEKQLKTNESYLRSEPEPVVRLILMRQQFDRLLKSCQQ